MRLWRHVQEDGLALEEVLPGSPLTPPLFLEFDCPGCDEFHSVSCDCDSDHEATFLCSCVPPTCPSCGHEFHIEATIALDDSEPILLDEPSYK
jgi:hypothetical protein